MFNTELITTSHSQGTSNYTYSCQAGFGFLKQSEVCACLSVCAFTIQGTGEKGLGSWFSRRLFFPSLITFLLLDLAYIEIIYVSYTPQWLVLHVNVAFFFYLNHCEEVKHEDFPSFLPSVLFPWPHVWRVVRYYWKQHVSFGFRYTWVWILVLPLTWLGISRIRTAPQWCIVELYT